MEEEKNNQAPAAEAPAPGQQATAENQPPATDKSQSASGDQNPDKIEISTEELNALKRDAGRWRAGKDSKSRSRDRSRDRNNDESGSNGDDNPLDEQIKLRDQQIEELRVTNNVLLVKENVRDILSSDEYSDIPNAIKQAVLKNPRGFFREDSKTVEHYIEDIRDYLDDVIDNIGDYKPASATPAPAKEPERPTPPASASGPSSPGANGKEDLTGKHGSERSRAVLRNILKR